MSLLRRIISLKKDDIFCTLSRRKLFLLFLSAESNQNEKINSNRKKISPPHLLIVSSKSFTQKLECILHDLFKPTKAKLLSEKSNNRISAKVRR